MVHWLVLLAIVALPLLVILLLVFFAPARQLRKYRFGGLLWFVSSRSYWGPACEGCESQYGLRPVFRSPEGTAYYELFCPRCLKPFSGRAFTVQALLEVDKQVVARLKGRQRERPLASAAPLPAVHKPPRT